jgi:hypothetical protein
MVPTRTSTSDPSALSNYNTYSISERPTAEFIQAVEEADGDIVKVLSEDEVLSLSCFFVCLMENPISICLFGLYSQNPATGVFGCVTDPNLSSLQRWFELEVNFHVRDGSHRTTYTCEYAATYPDDPKYQRLYVQLYWTSGKMDEGTARIIDHAAVKVTGNRIRVSKLTHALCDIGQYADRVDADYFTTCETNLDR